MVTHVVHCLNQFPWKHGVSQTLSPAGIVLGTPLPDYNALRIEFGAYAQVFEDNTPSNTPRARTLGAIALTPTGSNHGDFHFLSLASGNVISRHRWIAVPMTDTAIARIEALAFLENQPLIQPRGLVVEWRPDHPIDDYEYDPDFTPQADPVDDAFNPHDYDPFSPHELLPNDTGPPDFALRRPGPRSD